MGLLFKITLDMVRSVMTGGYDPSTPPTTEELVVTWFLLLFVAGTLVSYVWKFWYWIKGRHIECKRKEQLELLKVTDQAKDTIIRALQTLNKKV